MDNIILIDKKKSHYYYYFNKNNGLSIRSEYKGFKEPFWSIEGPELVDISITNYCERECSFCYRNSSKIGNHMKKNDFKLVLEYMKEVNTFQVALGGGNPNQHPSFIELLRMCREDYGIVPSYTTNGDGMTKDIIKASKKYCGAVAVSFYEPFEKFKLVLNKLILCGIKTNVHFLLTPLTVKIAIMLLKNLPKFLNGVNAIIFLNYKPVGLNASNHLLFKNSNDIEEFFNLINEHDISKFKIGFDSCTISGIVRNLNFDSKFIEACEGGRFSAFISEKMKLYPCSFMEKYYNGIDLTKNSIKELWLNSECFIEIREKIRLNTCKNKCKYEEYCMGGCPIFNEINLCNDEDMDL